MVVALIVDVVAAVAVVVDDGSNDGNVVVAVTGVVVVVTVLILPEISDDNDGVIGCVGCSSILTDITWGATGTGPLTPLLSWPKTSDFTTGTTGALMVAAVVVGVEVCCCCIGIVEGTCGPITAGAIATGGATVSGGNWVVATAVVDGVVGCCKSWGCCISVGCSWGNCIVADGGTTAAAVVADGIVGGNSGNTPELRVSPSISVISSRSSSSPTLAFSDVNGSGWGTSLGGSGCFSDVKCPSSLGWSGGGGSGSDDDGGVDGCCGCCSLMSS